MSPLQKRWTTIAERFGLKIRLGERLHVGGTEIIVPVLPEDFGGRGGMVLVSSFREIAAVEEALVASGFGYACLGEQVEGRIDAPNDDVAVMEMLRDWGWSGGGDAPCWYTDDAAG